MHRYYAVLPAQQSRRTRIGIYPELQDIPNMISGEMISASFVDPLEFALDREFPGDRQHFYPARMPLMTKHLVDTLKECGVNNLQLFPAVLVDPLSNARWTDYFAVNIIGAVASVDFANSDHTNDSVLIRAEFDGFVIDPAKAGDHRFFRLAESLGVVIAREDLRDCILSRESNALRFIPTEDFCT